MKLKNEGRKLRDGHKHSTSGFSTKEETKYKSVWERTGKAGRREGGKLEKALDFFRRKHILSGIHAPHKKKELLRGSSRSNPMYIYLKKEIIMKQEVNIQGKERPLYQPRNPRLNCIAIK